MPTEPIETPCTAVCQIDRASGLCRGCKRTVQEVANWLAYAPARRRAIMLELPQRTLPPSDARGG